ncbi:MAG: glucodextranase DOMON-like domain-containing protein [Gallionella sp.]
MKPVLLFVALILPMLNAWAGLQPLATISDPSGDDRGDGALVYPQRADFKPGDLDLLQLKISRDDEGYWFDAMFRNPIRDPAAVTEAVSSESLANFARKGFYQFNLDVYVDTDRIRDSGNTSTLPGRHVKIDPGYAWEKAVILTPRPELMRQQLLSALAEQYPERTKAETEASVDRSMYFPTRIRVRGRSVSFFVPAGFFAGSNGTDWAVTALVTGALTTIPADLSLFPSAKTPLEKLQLGVMQPETGHPRDTFGYAGVKPSPVVDMLSPSADQQMRQLAARDDLTGVSWGPHAVSDIVAPAAAALATGHKSDAPAAAKPVVPIGSLLQPTQAADKPEAGMPAPAKPEQAQPPVEQNIAARLKALQQLLDQKLIDESEYKQQKLRILNDL